MADGAIPVVDFGVMGLNCQSPPPHDDESVKALAEKIYTAFSTIGFVYLTNHGISDVEVKLCNLKLCYVMAVEGGLLFQAFLLFSRLLVTFYFKACSKKIMYIVLKSDGSK